MTEQQDAEMVTQFQAVAKVVTDFGVQAPTYEQVFGSLESQEDALRQAQSWAEQFARGGAWVNVINPDRRYPTRRFVTSQAVLTIEVDESNSKTVPAPAPVEERKTEPGERLKRYHTDATYHQLVDQARLYIRGACVHYDIAEVAGMLQLAVDIENREQKARR